MTDYNTIFAYKTIKIADNYKLNNQLVKAIEEYSELIQVLAKFRLTKDEEIRQRILSEMADCHIMTAQLVYLLRLKYSDLEKEIMNKLDRQIERIEHESESA